MEVIGIPIYLPTYIHTYIQHIMSIDDTIASALTQLDRASSASDIAAAKLSDFASIINSGGSSNSSSSSSNDSTEGSSIINGHTVINTGVNAVAEASQAIAEAYAAIENSPLSAVPVHSILGNTSASSSSSSSSIAATAAAAASPVELTKLKALADAEITRCEAETSGYRQRLDEALTSLRAT